ncbi:MAG TPA: putative glycoside hydrolase [Gemmatimonadales bacterium]|nr:putative glycoside hydrolase [Gemmatimonadales bacterium]
MKSRLWMFAVISGSLVASTPSLQAQRFPGGTSFVAEPPVRFGAAPDASHVSLKSLGAVWRGEWLNQFGRPSSVKALYVNAWAFSGNRLWQIVHMIDGTEINSLVIDVKDDTGCLLYHSQVETAKQIGADACARVKDVRARLDTLHAHGIYAIARIVVAKDRLLAEGKAAWSVKSTEGGLWRDRIGMAWVDAYNDSVWVYAGQLGREAVSLGFGEVQFDYVRFPDEPKSRMETAVFSARVNGETQRAAVRRHIKLLTDFVHPMGVPVTFDVFGLTASVTSGDLGIGQVWEDFSDVADVLLPMVYPSHYKGGSFGYRSPNANPYGVVRYALSDALSRSRAPNTAEIRPYLQAFTLGRRLPRYTPVEIRDQIQAAKDVGIESWVLWNPRSVYQRASLPPYPSTGRGREPGTGQE